MNDLELMRLHVEVLFTLDRIGDLDRVNEPDGAPAPRFFLGRTTDGLVTYFRHDVDQSLRRQIEAVASERRLLDRPLVEEPDTAPYERILTRVGAVKKIWCGPAFSFPRELLTDAEVMLVTGENAHLLEELLPAWLPDVALCQPMAALIVDGRAAAVCCSGRRTDMAHEAALETAPTVRRRGYAARVVPAWARAVRAISRVPLYSTAWNNEGSLAVARKLGLIHFGSDLHLT
ncbi:MAG TPA: GNAT family N-acetyltransferase [Gemmatimonadaceae bacterium]|nr:GNAT family N-acetyltransferase [Gemmatimonadaceae bacterium]